MSWEEGRCAEARFCTLRRATSLASKVDHVMMHLQMPAAPHTPTERHPKRLGEGPRCRVCGSVSLICRDSIRLTSPVIVFLS